MRNALSVLCVLALAPLPAVETGQPAPALDGVTWLKGDAVAPGHGTPTVVEFWATWCPPCRQSIPHLGALQRLYGDKVRIVGLSVEEDPEIVKPFVAKQGGVMSYGVGMIAQDRIPAWRGEEQTIPHAYLVDGSGKVVWHGLPLSLDGPLARLVDGSWDAKREADAAEVRDALLTMLGAKGLKDDDYERALTLTERLIALDPQDGEAVTWRLSLAKHLKHADVYDATLAGISTTALAPDHLAMIGSGIAADADFAWRRPDQAVRLAGAAFGRAADDPVIGDEWASVLATVCLVDQAIEVEKRAIAAAKRMSADSEGLTAALRYFERVAALRAAGVDTRSATGAAAVP